jgi:hypothetical protein
VTKLRYTIDGRQWLPVSRAAVLLGTNALGIRKLMAEGLLEWRQTRVNSLTFVVREDQVLALRSAKVVKGLGPTAEGGR